MHNSGLHPPSLTELGVWIEKKKQRNFTTRVASFYSSFTPAIKVILMEKNFMCLWYCAKIIRVIIQYHLHFSFITFILFVCLISTKVQLFWCKWSMQREFTSRTADIHTSQNRKRVHVQRAHRTLSVGRAHPRERARPLHVNKCVTLPSCRQQFNMY